MVVIKSQLLLLLLLAGEERFERSSRVVLEKSVVLLGVLRLRGFIRHNGEQNSRDSSALYRFYPTLNAVWSAKLWSTRLPKMSRSCGYSSYDCP